MQGSISHVSHSLQDRLGSQFRFLGFKQPRVRANLEYTLGLEFFRWSGPTRLEARLFFTVSLSQRTTRLKILVLVVL
jgi:hypothetical protein